MSRVTVYRTDRELQNYRRKVRRQKQVRRNIILTSVATLILTIFFITFYSFTSSANENTDDISYKYFTGIQVNEEDTLWSIAEEYSDEIHYDSVDDYIKEVMYINKLQDDVILCGQYLVVPYYSYYFK